MKNWRYLLASWFLGVFFLFLIARTGYLVFADGDRLLNQGNARSIREVNIPSPRAQILDRRGQPLAVSTPVYSVKASPKNLLAQEEKIRMVAAALEISDAGSCVFLNSAGSTTTQTSSYKNFAS